MYQSILYSTMFCVLFYAYFIVLKAIRIEKYFDQGKVSQIRLAYFLFSLMFAALTTMGLWKIIEIFQSSFIN